MDIPKEFIKAKREKDLFSLQATSSQINFGSSRRNQRPDTKGVVPVAHQWKSKKHSPVAYRDTKRLFVPHIPPQKETRKQHLLTEQRASAQFNPITGRAPLIA